MQEVFLMTGHIIIKLNSLLKSSLNKLLICSITMKTNLKLKVRNVVSILNWGNLNWIFKVNFDSLLSRNIYFKIFHVLRNI